MNKNEALLKRKPLLRFSVYTVIQVETVQTLGTEIRQILDVSLATDGVVDGAFQPLYGKFWLWILGTYEIVRTMGQAKNCFTSPVHDRLVSFKRTLAGLRIPFAKQEYAGHGRPIKAEASIYGFDFAARDVKFNVRGTDYFVRDLLDQFDMLIADIRPTDVLGDHRENAKLVRPPSS